MSGERRSITELKGRHAGADIWLIASGASMNHVDPAFFEGKVTVGVNDVYRRFPCSYLVRRTQVGAEEAYRSGCPLILSEYESGRLDGEQNAVSGPAWYFAHVNRALHQPLDLSVLGSDRIVVGASILVSGLHIAAYLGARHILLCGHDCGTLDGQLTFSGYYDGPLADPVSYWRLLKRFAEQTVAVRDKLQAVYGCRVYSLNPFVNFGLEGHVYRPEP